jgi:hypothetical protein
VRHRINRVARRHAASQLGELSARRRRSMARRGPPRPRVGGKRQGQQQ